MKDLAIIGFIALFVFTVLKAGILRIVSSTSLGDTDEHVLKLFEVVYGFLFVFAIIHICHALILIASSTIDERSEEFISLRQRFVNPSAPFVEYPIHPTFPFKTYLYRCQVRLLTKLIDVPYLTALCLLIPSSYVVVRYTHTWTLRTLAMSLILQVMFMVAVGIGQNSQSLIGSSPEMDLQPLLKSIYGFRRNRTDAAHALPPPWDTYLLQSLLFSEAWLTSFVAFLIIYPQAYQWTLIVCAALILGCWALWLWIIPEYLYLSCLDMNVHADILRDVEQKWSETRKRRHIQILKYMSQMAATRETGTFSETSSNRFYQLQAERTRSIVVSLFNLRSDAFVYDDESGFIEDADLKDVLRLVSEDEQTQNELKQAVKVWFEEKHADDMTFKEFVHLLMTVTPLGQKLQMEQQEELWVEHKKGIKALFDRMDENGDGKISSTEFKNLCRGVVPPLKDDEIKDLFMEISKTRDHFLVGDLEVFYNSCDV